MWMALLAFTERTRQRAYSLVAQAYTSITAEDFAAFVGYSVEEAVKGKTSLSDYISSVISTFKKNPFFSPVVFLCVGVVSQGWQADPATRMVMPKKPGRWQCFSFDTLMPKQLSFRQPTHFPPVY